MRKARMDAELQIKELAQELGVNEGSVINWELKGMMPAARNMEKMTGMFPGLPC